jgi:hypothetical protein
VCLVFQYRGEVTSGPLFLFWMTASLCGAPTVRQRNTKNQIFVSFALPYIRQSYTHFKRDSVTRFFASGFFHESFSPQPQSIPWSVKPLVKRPGGFTYVRPRLKRAEKEYRKLYGVPSVPAWGHLRNPNHAAPLPSGGGGRGRMVRTDPSHSLSGTAVLPWGVGIRLIRKGLSRQPRVHDLRYGVGLLLTSLFSSSLVASLYLMASLNGKHYQHTIQRIPSGSSLILIQICHWYQRHRRQICHWYQQHRRQILLPVSPVSLITVANLPPVSTITVENLPLVSTTTVAMAMTPAVNNGNNIIGC